MARGGGLTARRSSSQPCPRAAPLPCRRRPAPTPSPPLLAQVHPHAFPSTAGAAQPAPLHFGAAQMGVPPLVDASAGRGVCMMSTSWRDRQRPDLVNFIATFLATNLYRLNFLSLSPDFLFNNGGLSVAFIFETDWLPEREAAVFSRVNILKRQFKYLYVVVVVCLFSSVCNQKDIITAMRIEGKCKCKCWCRCWGWG